VGQMHSEDEKEIGAVGAAFYNLTTEPMLDV
jgi:hypothetical protein